MAKAQTTNSIQHVGAHLPALPAFMEQDGAIGTDALKSYVRPPRIAVVQRNSNQSILDRGFGAGDLIQKPLCLPVVELPRDNKGNPVSQTGPRFRFIPLCFWVEWIKWNPIELKGKAPAILERTTDPSHPLAAKCRTPSTWVEKHPENKEWKIKNIEHLNFLVSLLGVPGVSPDDLFCLSFQSGEHVVGTSLCGLIKARKAPIFGCVFEANAQFRDRGGWQWWGIDVWNPTENPWITDATAYANLKQVHLDLEKARLESRIVVEHDDDEQTQVASASDY